MKKILIIDDEKDLRELIKSNLEITGLYKVLTAANGNDGLRLAEIHKPDLILLDIIMPGIDGFNVLKKLKESEHSMCTPVIMLSALGDMNSKARAASMYGEDYIVKPVETNDLLAKLESILR